MRCPEVVDELLTASLHDVPRFQQIHWLLVLTFSARSDVVRPKRVISIVLDC